MYRTENMKNSTAVADRSAKYSEGLKAIARARGFTDVRSCNRPIEGNGRGITVGTKVGKFAYGTFHLYSESDITRMERELWTTGYHPRQRAAK